MPSHELVLCSEWQMFVVFLMVYGICDSIRICQDNMFVNGVWVWRWQNCLVDDLGVSGIEAYEILTTTHIFHTFGWETPWCRIGMRMIYVFDDGQTSSIARYLDCTSSVESCKYRCECHPLFKSRSFAITISNSNFLIKNQSKREIVSQIIHFHLKNDLILNSKLNILVGSSTIFPYKSIYS